MPDEASTCMLCGELEELSIHDIWTDGNSSWRRAVRVCWIQCQVTLQRAAGGDADIGRRLHPLLVGAVLQSVQVSPRLVYVDASRPAMVEGFVRNTFTAMVAGVRQKAIRTGLSTATLFDAGIQALLRTTDRTACSATLSSRPSA